MHEGLALRCSPERQRQRFPTPVRTWAVRGLGGKDGSGRGSELEKTVLLGRGVEWYMQRRRLTGSSPYFLLGVGWFQVFDVSVESTVSLFWCVVRGGGPVSSAGMYLSFADTLLESGPMWDSLLPRQQVGQDVPLETHPRDHRPLGPKGLSTG